jgi:hypothetical protein
LYGVWVTVLADPQVVRVAELFGFGWQLAARDRAVHPSLLGGEHRMLRPMLGVKRAAREF